MSRMIRGLPRGRRRILPTLVLLGVLYLLYNQYISSSSGSDIKVIPFEDPLPLISLILIYVGDKLPINIPYLLESIARQPHALELVFVQRNGCSDLGSFGKVGNIKHICLSEDKFWGLHRDYFCSRWGGCSRSARRNVLEDMKNLGKVKNKQSFYPIIRGWVFKKYINPKASYWGYCDPDTIMGDFSQNFPYDAASDNYDIMLPTEPTDNGGVRLVFMRGHLGVVRNTPETEAKIHHYKYFGSHAAWDEMGLPGPSVQEAEYSHFVVGDPRLNLLLFDGLMPTVPVRSSSIVGVLTLPDALAPASGQAPTLQPNVIRALTTPSLHLPKYPSFTDRGIEHSVEIVQGSKPQETGLWFNETFVSWYNAIPNPPSSILHGSQGTHTKQRWRRYLIKKDNKWTERLEPLREFRGNYIDGGLDTTYQWLYAHWQEEKKKAHWRQLPALTSPEDILMVYQDRGNAAFDSRTGERHFWLTKKDEDCYALGCVEVGSIQVKDSEKYKERQRYNKLVGAWYVESKQIRLGLSTGTLGPYPSKPTL